MDEDSREFVRDALQGVYTFSATLNEHAENPKYLPVPIGKAQLRANSEQRADLSRWLVLCANVVHAFAEAVEVEFVRTGNPGPSPPGRAQRK